MSFLSNGQDLKWTVFNSGGPKPSISVGKGGAWGSVSCGWAWAVGQPGEGWQRRWMLLMEPGVSPLILTFGFLWDQSELGVSGPCRAVCSLSLTLLQLRHNHHEMGMPRAGFCRDLAHSLVPDHWGTQHKITTDKTLQKYPWPGPEWKQLHAHSQCSPRVKA